MKVWADENGAWAPMAEVSFQGVTRIYPGMDHPAVDDLTLDIRDGELLVLVGPSGCGKSTALRMLAGLEPIDSGRVLIDGVDVTNLPARDRNIAMVFQSYALYPHMTVAENIAFHLTLQHVAVEEIRRRVHDVADLLGLSELLDRRPSKLSGGQRQRVAMGRALIRHPKVFLMDEPLSNLDAKLRIHMRTEIASIQKQFRTSTLYVTHDQIEAMTLGDRVAVQRDGVLQQCAPPMELYNEPVNEFVARFIGSPAMNLLAGRVRGGEVVVDDGLRFDLTGDQRRALTSDRVTIGVRPESWTIGTETGIGATIKTIESLGSESFMHCDAAGVGDLVVRATRRTHSRVGDRVTLQPRPHEIHIFDSATHARLPATNCRSLIGEPVD